VWHVLRGTTFHRVTAAGNGPWWFSSDGSGRFDLGPPRGTCYLADDPLVALLEALGVLASAPVVDPAVLDGRSVWTLALPEQCDAADTTTRRARGFGVTAELAAGARYALAQRWATALAAAGFGGLRYRARHDPGGGRCLALFGAAGERRRWKRGRPAPVGPSLLDRLRAEAGVVLAAAGPSVESLQLVDDGEGGSVT
jgi:hypothetical protein